MLIDHTQEYDEIWDRIDDELKFKPSCSYRGHSMSESIPFEIEHPYSVYAIDEMNEDQIEIMDNLIRKCLIMCADENTVWYALDWQHSAFKFNPQNIEEQKSVWFEDERYFGGGYDAFFPSFYPDGDYYFFIDENFENGYLGHPWRQEVWVFGSKLKAEIEKNVAELGWRLIISK